MQINSRFFLLLCLLLVTPLAIAAPDLSSSSLIDTFKTTSSQFYGNIQHLALELLWSLTMVSFAWAVGKKIPQGVEFQEVLVILIKLALGPGVYTMFILKGTVWMPSMFDGFKLFATTGTGMDWNDINPSAIFDMGLDLQKTIMWTFLKAQGVTGMMSLAINPLPSILFATVELTVLFSFGFMALNFFAAIAEMYILMAIAPLLWAFGGTEWTRDIALKSWNSLIATGVKIVVIAIVLSIGVNLGPLMANEAAMMSLLNWDPLWRVAFMSAGFAYISIKAGQIAGSALSGTSSLSAGEAISMGVAAAGAAVGLAGAGVGAAAGAANLAKGAINGIGNAVSSVSGAGNSISGLRDMALPRRDPSLDWMPGGGGDNGLNVEIPKATGVFNPNPGQDIGNASNASIEPEKPSPEMQRLMEQLGQPGTTSQKVASAFDITSQHVKNLQGLAPNDGHSVGGDLTRHVD